MRTVVTGAGGFVGRKLVELLLARAGPEDRLTLVDSRFGCVVEDSRVRQLEGDLRDPGLRSRALEHGVDRLIHLAAVPGAAAEADYSLSRAVNLDATLSLFEEAAAAGKVPRVVFASTIAVLGAPLPAEVNDDTPARPAMIYGAHKLMMEIALADLGRRGALDAVSVRLPGIVPRPPGPSGMKSAFMSEIFHRVGAGEPFVCPVSADATTWLMSVSRCAANLLQAADGDTGLLPPGRAVTMPALRVRIGELADVIASASGRPAQVTFQPDAQLEEGFGRYPPLSTPAAEAFGLRHDGDLRALVRQALSDAS